MKNKLLMMQRPELSECKMENFYFTLNKFLKVIKMVVFKILLMLKTSQTLSHSDNLVDSQEYPIYVCFSGLTNTTKLY